MLTNINFLVVFLVNVHLRCTYVVQQLQQAFCLRTFTTVAPAVWGFSWMGCSARCIEETISVPRSILRFVKNHDLVCSCPSGIFGSYYPMHHLFMPKWEIVTIQLALPLASSLSKRCRHLLLRCRAAVPAYAPLCYSRIHWKSICTKQSRFHSSIQPPDVIRMLREEMMMMMMMM